MNENTTVLGLDVHKETVAAALLPGGATMVHDLGVIPNTPEAIRKLVKRARGHGDIEAVYEAGPCGYATYRQLKGMGVGCAVVAPSLIPVRPGDQVKTDRRDAEKLARLYRAGELTAIGIPGPMEEAARDLVRAREDVVANRLRARHRLSKFLLRQGRIWREGRAWTGKHEIWMQGQRFDEPLQQMAYEAARRGVAEMDAHLEVLSQQVEDAAQEKPWREVVGALRALKGVDTLAAMTLAVEVHDFWRFPGATAFMAYTGLVGREDSSGGRIRRMGITRAGNAHVRRVLVEAAWHYRHSGNKVGPRLAERRAATRAEWAQMGRRAQDRLERKFRRLTGRGKSAQVAVVATARELAGFAWALARAASAEKAS
jgi:transposase